ncbi:MAG: class I SAM-dependent methyltransferase [Pseudomonadota bacterium]|nr:class I SAM-dependent methyltransferase [Pseudomonadota bacterium]
MTCNIFYTSKKHKNYAEEIAKKLGSRTFSMIVDNEKPYLEVNDLGLSFFHPKARAKKKFIIDFNSRSMSWRLKRADHEKLIKKALGKSEQPQKILDCTAGLLQDSLLFLSLGHEVTAVEQSNILFNLLEDGIKRSKENEIFSRLTLVNANACSFVREAKEFDVIYFDPMFPPSKKTALRSAQIEYLAKILEHESIKNNPKEEFQLLQSMSVNKLIVKRPINASPFGEGINYQVKGKTIRFDIYI